jgi:hypothetical protein
MFKYKIDVFLILHGLVAHGAVGYYPGDIYGEKIMAH